MNPESLTTRREFLDKNLTLLAAGATVPAFLDRTAWALDDPKDVRQTRSRPGVPEDRILVIVQLAGGNDGLNTVIPYGHNAYRRARPRLAIAGADVLKFDDDFGFHPAAKGLRQLYDDGLLSIVQGVGYPNPNRSHFRSTDIWATASPDGHKYDGWMGRYFDNTCRGSDPCPPEAAIALTSESPLTLRGDRFQPVSFTNPQALRWVGGRRPAMAEAFAALNQPDEAGPPPVTELDYLRRTALNARVSSAKIREANRGRSRADYASSPFARSLRTIARMIAAELPTRVYYAALGGFDTHAGQANRHRQLLTQLGDGLRAFLADLKAQGNLDRVVVMTFSEFGRRVAENGSGGTDHGEASSLFLLGTKVHAGLHGQHPDLERLNRGDLAFTTDFRRVYASVLTDWLGADATSILGQRFEPLKLIRA